MLSMRAPAGDDTLHLLARNPSNMSDRPHHRYRLQKTGPGNGVGSSAAPAIILEKDRMFGI